MILNEGGQEVRGCHKALGCRYCFSRVSREMGPWASGSGVLGNAPGEKAASRRGCILLLGGTWQWEVLGRLREGASRSLPPEVLRHLGLALKISKSQVDQPVRSVKHSTSSVSLYSPGSPLLSAPGFSSSYLQAGFIILKKIKQPNQILSPGVKRGLFCHLITEPNQAAKATTHTHTQKILEKKIKREKN